MNFRLVFKLTGKVLLVESCAMVLPLLVGFFYGDNPMPFLATIPLLAAVGLVLAHIQSDDLSTYADAFSRSWGFFRPTLTAFLRPSPASPPPGPPFSRRLNPFPTTFCFGAPSSTGWGAWGC